MWLHFLTPLAFMPLSFRNGARYLKSKTKSVSIDDGPISFPNRI